MTKEMTLIVLLNILSPLVKLYLALESILKELGFAFFHLLSFRLCFVTLPFIEFLMFMSDMMGSCSFFR